MLQLEPLFLCETALHEHQLVELNRSYWVTLEEFYRIVVYVSSCVKVLDLHLVILIVGPLIDHF